MCKFVFLCLFHRIFMELKTMNMDRKKFFKQIVISRTDYEYLLPMTIGINNNKYKKILILINFTKKTA